MKTLLKTLWALAAVLLVGFMLSSPIKQAHASPKKIMTAVMASGWIVHVWNEPCEYPDVLKIIDKDMVEEFRAGQSVSPKGEKLNLCWILDEEGRVFVIDSHSDHGSIDVRGFKDKSI